MTTGTTTRSERTGPSRDALLAAVADISETLQRHAAASEAQGFLHQESFAALHRSGLLSLKLPRVLGGAEADPVTQIEVIEALSAVEPSAGWSLMIGATSIGAPGAFLPATAIERMFSGGRIPSAASVAMPVGRAARRDGGYRLSGRWPFASGVRHAEWITLGAMAETDGGAVERRMLTLPIASVRVHDNWQVAGLQATGSSDVSVDDCFVPGDFTWRPLSDAPQRGGALYHLRNPGFVANEHAAFALGVARLALDTAVASAASRRRGSANASLADRHMFQQAVGMCDLKLRSARLLVTDTFARVWRDLEAGRMPPAGDHASMRAAAVLATDVALDVTTSAFRYTGGSAVYRPNILQRCLRDLNVAAQHFMVSNSAYEAHGASVLGLPDVDPMR